MPSGCFHDPARLLREVHLPPAGREQPRPLLHRRQWAPGPRGRCGGSRAHAAVSRERRSPRPAQREDVEVHVGRRPGAQAWAARRTHRAAAPSPPRPPSSARCAPSRPRAASTTATSSPSWSSTHWPMQSLKASQLLPYQSGKPNAAPIVACAVARDVIARPSRSMRRYAASARKRSSSAPASSRTRHKGPDRRKGRPPRTQGLVTRGSIASQAATSGRAGERPARRTPAARAAYSRFPSGGLDRIGPNRAAKS